MKKFRLVALALILSLLIMPRVAWADENSTYLALGDSIAYGHGASSTTTFPGDYLLYNQSVPPGYGYTDMLYRYLNKSRGVDSYINASSNGLTSEQLKSALLNASSMAYIPTDSDDFVTVSVGGNDVLGPLKEFVGMHPEYLVDGYFENQITDLTKLPPELVELVVLLTKNSISFKSNWKVLMGNLRDRTDATIIVNTVYNPFPAGSALNIFATPFLETINLPIRSMCRTYGYKVADIKVIFDILNSSRRPLVHDLSDMNMALHPTDRGYEAIYSMNQKLVPRNWR